MSDPRAQLADQQRALLAALVAGAAPPEGFDAERLRIQAGSLIAKRRGLVAVARPDVVQALGSSFGREFQGYASGRPKPQGGSRADAAAFAEWVRSRGLLPEPPEAPQEQKRHWWRLTPKRDQSR
ncbi:hypothetical protein [Herbidospora mongoliensis]|uniref:hypothetical protein n=1 Tax=Herbidospora mongoliensis TaxID=688067 RepID=UPI00082BA1AE|nr:hypothetical protein [Herbidospora mongoliensis]